VALGYAFLSRLRICLIAAAPLTSCPINFTSPSKTLPSKSMTNLSGLFWLAEGQSIFGANAGKMFTMAKQNPLSLEW
jgi:hypothetical protein